MSKFMSPFDFMHKNSGHNNVFAILDRKKNLVTPSTKKGKHTVTLSQQRTPTVFCFYIVAVLKAKVNNYMHFNAYPLEAYI